MSCWRRLALVPVALFVLFCTSCQSADTVTIQGAGATFPAPLYKRWFLEYYNRHPEVRVNYQAIGSGAGIRQFNEGLTDFGATDGFPSKDELATAQKAKFGMLPLPMTAGSVAICYNIPDAPNGLHLSRDVYVNIFLGKIDNWNDPVIAKDNPNLSLSSLPITVVRRAESSGTTFAFTNHLNAVSKAWRKENGGPGKGKSVEWPTKALGGKGNAGVAALIQQTPGAIGYLEHGYAELAGLPIAALQNKAGSFVEPGLKSGLAALGGPNLQKIPANLHIEITDPDGEGAYPIVTYTWILARQRYDNPRVGAKVLAVLDYCLTDGQKISSELGYLPLPEEVVTKVRALVKTIEVGN